MNPRTRSGLSLIWHAVLLLAPACCAPVVTAQDAEMDLVEGRILQSLNTGIASAATIDGLQSSLQADGTWADLDYTSTAQTAWPPRTHLDRMKTMAKHHAFGAGQGDTVLRDDIFRAYDAWISRDPQSSNWWYQAIGTPQPLGEILILMGNEVSAPRLSSGLTLLARAYVARATNSGTNTGANRVDRAYSSMMRGLLANDSALTTESFLAIGDTILVNSAHTFAEGIQPDHSFQQHGAQLYTAGYGYGYAAGILRYASWGAGSRFGYSDRQKRVILDHMLDGAQWHVRGNTIEYTSYGRGVTRAGSGSQAVGYGAMLDQALAISGGYRQAELTAFRSRIIAGASAADPATSLSGNRNFWRADLMVHHRPGFSASVKTSSTRTLQPESGNGEGLKNLHFGDGVTLIQRTGNEYDSIMPVWDWRRLPGITAEQGTYSLKPTTDWGMYGNSTFAGGVSDGTDGVAAFDYSRLGVSALKSWFFLGDVMIALGANVSASASTAPVLTTVNQALQSGSVTCSAGSSTSFTSGTVTPSGLRWVHHDKTGYFFPDEPSDIVVTAQPQTGTWQSLNTSQSADSVTKDVFSLHFNHGSAFTGKSYAYVVAPGVEIGNMDSFPRANYVILRNDSTVQAVRDQAAAITAATFRAAGTVDGISSSAKACVLLKRSPGFVDLTVSDPSQSNTGNITIELTTAAAGVIRADTGVTVESLSPAIRVRISTAKSYGRSFRVRFFTRAHAYQTISLAPSADSFVYDGSPNTNYGTNVSLAVKLITTSNQYTRESFLRFPVGGVQPVAASLKLMTLSSNTPGLQSVHPVAAGTWTENGITWNNRPYPTGPSAALWLPVLNERVSADVTGVLSQAVGGNLDLCVITHAPTSDGYAGYASRDALDAAQHPTLEMIVPRSEFEIWRIESFGAAVGDPLVSGDAADPDGDGENNLLEFATAQSPSGGGRADITLQRPTDPAFLEFIYQRRKNSGLAFRVTWSGDLADGHWTSDGIPDQNPVPVASDEISETIAVRVPAGTGRRFVRLEVTGP